MKKACVGRPSMKTTTIGLASFVIVMVEGADFWTYKTKPNFSKLKKPLKSLEMNEHPLIRPLVRRIVEMGRLRFLPD